MIRKECFTKEWIETVSNRLHYNDLNLIEKVIREFSLVNMLSESGYFSGRFSGHFSGQFFHR